MAKVELKDKLVQSVEQINPCERKFSFVIDKETVAAETGRAVRMFINSVVIPGFRKGKAPEATVRSRYAAQIDEELKRLFITTAGQEAASQDKEKIIAVSYGQTLPEIKHDEEYKFSVTVIYTPTINLPEYKGLTVELAPMQVTEDEINARLEYFRQSGARYASVEGAAQAEDMLKISYTSDFVLPENASPSLQRQVTSESNWLWLKTPPVTIPGAVEALTGAEKDKDYEFTAVYPGDWKEKELAGATVNYKVKVLDVQRQTVVSVEDICSHFKVNTVEEMRAEISKMIMQDKEKSRSEEIFNAVYQKLSEAIGIFHMPEMLMAKATDKFVRQIVSEMVKSEEDVQKVKDDINAIRQQATKTAAEFVRHNLIVGEIARAEKISVDQNEVDSQLKMMAKMYGQKPNELAKKMSEDDFMDLQNFILSDKVKNLLVKHTTVNVKA
jgi:trigger factor